MFERFASFYKEERMKAVQLIALLSVAVAAALFGGCSDDEKEPAGPNGTVAADTVWVSSVSAAANEEVKVDITIRNSAPIASLEVPLRLAGNNFVIDSGSYVGGSFADAALKSAIIDPSEKTVYFIAAHSAGTTVPAGTTHLASLYVTLGADAADQVIEVDSAFVNISGNVYHVVSFATPDMTQILPKFVPGQIDVAP